MHEMEPDRDKVAYCPRCKREFPWYVPERHLHLNHCPGCDRITERQFWEESSKPWIMEGLEDA
jgi:hypothetical protein